LRTSILLGRGGIATLVLAIARGLASALRVGALLPALFGLSFGTRRRLRGDGSALLLAIVIRAERIAAAAPMPATSTVLLGSTFGSLRLFRIIG